MDQAVDNEYDVILLDCHSLEDIIEENSFQFPIEPQEESVKLFNKNLNEGVG